jgi:hypothetical protein
MKTGVGTSPEGKHNEDARAPSEIGHEDKMRNFDSLRDSTGGFI